MEDLIKKYIEDPNFRELTLKQAIAEIKNVKQTWVKSIHPDFNCTLIEIMGEKSKIWESKGIDTSQVDFDVIVSSFKEYNPHYIIEKPEKVIELEERLKFVEQHSALLNIPGVPTQLLQHMTSQFETIIKDLKRQIADEQ